MNTLQLAEILFPHIDKDIAYYEEKYPYRNLGNSAKVTRLGPSPTGFIHLGNLYGALIDERLAHSGQGVMFLRIEDTDDKRKVEGAEQLLIHSLEYFGIHFDEGVTPEGEIGNYGPYTQSKRVEIYQTVAKELVRRGMAYPSFQTEEELSAIRATQEAAKAPTTGYYGEWAADRNLSEKEINDKLEAGLPWVLRLKSDGDSTRALDFKDAVKGKITVYENNQDIVLLKTNGVPTYHFAHVVDDHFMRVTHVVRGEEWLATLPIHLELFNKLGWRPPTYCHTAHLMKLEDGKRRKLSKRKDPELSLGFYMETGYFPEAVREYLMILLNSNYEDWRRQNPTKALEEFPFKINKLGTSGALFDINKLDDVSKNTLVTLSETHIADFLINWAKQYQTDCAELLKQHRDEVIRLLSIGRKGKKPRKDLVHCRQIMEFISYYFDETFALVDELPQNVSVEDAKSILKDYLSTYKPDDDNGKWFEKVKTIGERYQYTGDMRAYKENPDAYRGNISHVSTVVRLALTGKSISPDLWEIQQIMGIDKVQERIRSYSLQLS